MSLSRRKSRKTNSPRKVVSQDVTPELLLEFTESTEVKSTLPEGFESVPGDPKDLAEYIMHNGVINFVETPRLPEVYYAEISHVRLNAKPEEEMVYNCRGCNKKSYRSVSGLRAHVVNCPGLPKSTYTCVVCNKKFNEQIFATDHIKGNAGLRCVFKPFYKWVLL